MSIRDLIARVTVGQQLTEDEAAQAIEEVMSGAATPAQTAAFLIALKMRGETIDEITGAARVLRRKATPVATKHPLLADTCGTGGGRVKTFNISTAAAFVVAGAGVPVAKHGNRSYTTQCGSADVLEALGVNLGQTPEQVGQTLDQVGVGFLFAPSLHLAMRHVAGLRRELGVDTIFNVLGPLTNPAGAQAQVIGVYREDLVEKVAGAALRLGTRTALVVHGDGGMDEIALSGPTLVAEVRDGAIRNYTVRPEDVGLEPAPPEALRGGTPAENAEILLRVLKGVPGPARDVVCLNAGAALYAAGAAASLREGVLLARASIDSGRARGKLDGLRLVHVGLRSTRELPPSGRNGNAAAGGR